MLPVSGFTDALFEQVERIEEPIDGGESESLPFRDAHRDDPDADDSVSDSMCAEVARKDGEFSCRGDELASFLAFDELRGLGCTESFSGASRSAFEPGCRVDGPASISVSTAELRGCGGLEIFISDGSWPDFIFAEVARITGEPSGRVDGLASTLAIEVELRGLACAEDGFPGASLSAFAEVARITGEPGCDVDGPASMLLTAAEDLSAS
jgi:hypothetical protein